MGVNLEEIFWHPCRQVLQSQFFLVFCRQLIVRAVLVVAIAHVHDEPIETIMDIFVNSSLLHTV